MKNEFEISKKTNLQISKRNNLQTKELSNSMRASQNRANEGEPQTASDSTKKRIPKFQKHKTVTSIGVLFQDI